MIKIHNKKYGIWKTRYAENSRNIFEDWVRPHHRIPVRIKLPGRIMRVGIEDVGHSFALTLNEEFAIRNCQTLFLISHY